MLHSIIWNKIKYYIIIKRIIRVVCQIEKSTTSNHFFIFQKSHHTLKNDGFDLDGVEDANYTCQ